MVSRKALGLLLDFSKVNWNESAVCQPTTSHTTAREVR